MNNLKRYSLGLAWYGAGDPTPIDKPDPAGHLINYEDHLKAVQEAVDKERERIAMMICDHMVKIDCPSLWAELEELITPPKEP